MSMSTLITGRVRRGDGAPRTPCVRLDVPVALDAARTAGLQVVPDAFGGIVLDAGHRAVVPLLPFLAATRTWIWVGDPARIGRTDAARAGLTTVVDGRGRGGSVAHRSTGGLTVVAVDDIGVGAEPPGPGTAVLVDLTGVREGLIGSRPLATTSVIGFHLDLAGLSPDRVSERVDVLNRALRRRRATGRSDRPLLVLRGARTPLARQVVGAALRACRAGGMPAPVVRVDVTPTVLDIGVSTVVRVIAVGTRGGGTVLDVDGLPRFTGVPLRVVDSDGPPARPVDVLLCHRGRLVSATVSGGPVRVGTELAASGWTETERPLVVRGFPAAPKAIG